MKRIILVLSFVVPFFAFSQSDFAYFQDIFFGRQPTAHAEALGGSLSSLDGDLSATYYNPAASSSIEGLQVAGSYSSPYSVIDDAYYNYLGAGYKLNRFLTFGITRYHFSYGEIYLTDETGTLTGGKVKPRDSFYTLNLSSEPRKNLYVGININYQDWEFVQLKDQTLFADFGIIKKFIISREKNKNQSVNVGAGITNFTFSKLKPKIHDEVYEYKLPAIARFGVNYSYGTGIRERPDSLEMFKVTVLADYNTVLNSAYFTSFRSGAELQFFEFVLVRLGYYNQFINDHDMPEYYKDHLSQFTWGLGINFPLHKIAEIPLQFTFDYTSLPQESYIREAVDYDNFTTWSARLSIFL
ncbi:MAG TPA: hypothetical protein P5514_13490 [Bacteroidales bacterium]|nr:hypothetical protein [Bacteroidales bacterium]